MLDPDPTQLAAWQLARDEATARRFPGIFERKLARMAASPLAYLRGSAPLFYRLLSEHAELGDGPDGEGWICGDAHLENFGAFRTERNGAQGADVEEQVVFDINDFDETVVGPWRFDVLRLVTSVILGGRALGTDGRHSLALARRLVAAHAGAAFGGGANLVAPRHIQRLLQKVERRSHRDFLDKRTEVIGGRRRFKLGDRYAKLPASIEAGVPATFERYVRELPNGNAASDRFEILDTAFRIAGTGSLGSLRIAVLTRGKGDPEGGWLFDMKEEMAPSLPAPPALVASPGTRVATGTRLCLRSPPRMIGTSQLGETPLFVRRLLPQEDKLDLTRVDPAELEELAGYLGALVGRAHHRAATHRPEAEWSEAAQQALINRAIAMAGLHESAYLAMCNAMAPGSAV